MPYNDASPSFAGTPPEHSSYAVANLRSWLGCYYPNQLPPEREDEEAALREILELMVRVCPANLPLLQHSQLEAMDIMQMTGEEAAKSDFFVRAIESVFRPDDAESGATIH